MRRRWLVFVLGVAIGWLGAALIVALTWPPAALP